jgi:hypothetical protein
MRGKLLGLRADSARLLDRGIGLVAKFVDRLRRTIDFCMGISLDSASRFGHLALGVAKRTFGLAAPFRGLLLEALQCRFHLSKFTRHQVRLRTQFDLGAMQAIAGFAFHIRSQVLDGTPNLIDLRLCRVPGPLGLAANRMRMLLQVAHAVLRHPVCLVCVRARLRLCGTQDAVDFRFDGSRLVGKRLTQAVHLLLSPVSQLAQARLYLTSGMMGRVAKLPDLAVESLPRSIERSLCVRAQSISLLGESGLCVACQGTDIGLESLRPFANLAFDRLNWVRAASGIDLTSARKASPRRRASALTLAMAPRTSFSSALARDCRAWI